ncbi:stringent starvation protein A [Rickettsiales bacterium Ac37b]|nr:stringent starvation protein A [Rickettsiales bacterium Ac37b]
MVLNEKGVEFELIQEEFWKQRKEFIRLNPASEVPVLIDKSNKFHIADVMAIYEYLEEKHTNKSLLGSTLEMRAEVRRVTNWFNNKFYHEVSRYIINERIIAYYARKSAPNSQAIRAAKINIHYHLEYINFLLKQRRWLASEYITIADFAASVQLSVLDYLGDVPWEQYINVKNWYSVLKSRPSFRSFLQDKITGFEPSLHYKNLDF